MEQTHDRCKGSRRNAQDFEHFVYLCGPSVQCDSKRRARRTFDEIGDGHGIQDDFPLVKLVFGVNRVEWAGMVSFRMTYH